MSEFGQSLVTMHISRRVPSGNSADHSKNRNESGAEAHRVTSRGLGRLGLWTFEIEDEYTVGTCTYTPPK